MSLPERQKDSGESGNRDFDRAVAGNGGLSSASDFRKFFQIVARRWWLIALCGLLGAGAAWWNQRGEVPRYTAEVLLQQRGEESLSGILGVSGSRSGVDFGAQLEIIRSRAVLAAVVDSLGLQLRMRGRANLWTRLVGDLEARRDVEAGRYHLRLEDGQMTLRQGSATGAVITRAAPGTFLEGPGFGLRVADPSVLDQPVEFSISDAEVAVDRLRRQIRVEPARGSNLLRVSFSDPDPALAAAVVNGIAAAYQRHRAQTAREAVSRRRAVIAEQLVQLADSLKAVQELALEYQQRSELLDPRAQGNVLLTALLETENDLRRMRFEEGLLESFVVGLQAGEIDDESVARVLSLGRDLIPSGERLYQRLQELDAERSRLTASRFGRTDASPEVQVVDSLSASTRNQLRVAAEQSLDLLRSRVEAAERRHRELRGQVGGLPGRTAELNRFQQRVDAVQEVFDMLVERYYEVQIAEGVEVGDVEVVDPAVVPLRPNPSRGRLNIVLALMAGLMTGTIGAAALEQLDSSVREATDAEEATRLEVIGKIPRIKSPDENSEVAQIGKEAFRAIRTNLRFVLTEQPRVIAVTSATPGEGKTTVATNLALALVEQRAKTVLLLDADLRRPVLHRILQVRQSPGLSSVLDGSADLEQAIRVSRFHPRLQILPSGPRVANPSELLGDPEFEELITLLRGRYDAVIIDTPPLLAVTDPVLVATVADGTLVVVRESSTGKSELKEAVAHLRRAEATLLGIVINGVSPNKGGYSYYGAYQNDATPYDKTVGTLLVGSSSEV